MRALSRTSPARAASSAPVDPVHVVELGPLGVPQQDHEAEDDVARLERDDQHRTAVDERADVALFELRGDGGAHLLADPGHQDGLAGGHALEERGVGGERHGLADRHHVVPAARLLDVFQRDAMPQGPLVGRPVGEALARDDLLAQIRAGDIGEARHDGGADFLDRAGQVERGADASADLVEEFKALAHRRVFEVRGEFRRRRQRSRHRLQGVQSPRLALFGAPGNSPVGRHGHPVVLAELQDGIAQFEDLGDDAGALADAHAGQDLRQPPGQFVGSWEVGVQGEAGRYALHGAAVVVRVSSWSCAASAASTRRRSGPGPISGYAHHSTSARSRPGSDSGRAARARVGGAAGEGAVEAGAELLEHLVVVEPLLQRPGDREQIGGGPADSLFLGGAEQLARTGGPVRHQAVAVHDDHGKRNPPGHGERLRRCRRSATVHGWKAPSPPQECAAAGPP